MKTIDANFTTHLAQTVTTLATIWRITREDGVQFFFTDHDQDLTISGNVYKASTGYNRSALTVNAQLSVDNLDIEGIYADAGINEDELRAGLFDYADVEISMVNWSDLTQGELKLKKGRLGEAVISTQGFYTAEVRGLAQQLSQTMLQIYQPECRVDLGSPECGVPILPDIIDREEVIPIGQFYRVPTGRGMTPALSLLVNGSFEADTAGPYNQLNPITGWEIVGSDSFNLVTKAGDLNPDAGTLFLTGTIFDFNEEIRQDIHVVVGTISEATIDAGNVSVAFTSRRANSFASDTGRVRVEFLNSSKAVIGTGLDTGLEEIIPSGTWVDRNMTATSLSVGTRYVRVRLDYQTVAGTLANACFDNLSLTVQDGRSLTVYEQTLDDPSFEMDAVGTYSTSVQMTDWTVISGEWDIAMTSTGLNPSNGTSFIIGTDTFDAGELEQIVDLVSEGFSATRIDNNGLQTRFSIQRANTLGNGKAGRVGVDFDDGRVRLDFLDVNNVLIGTGLDTGLENINPTNTWVTRRMKYMAVPRLTRKIRVRLDYDRVRNTQSFAAFEDAELFILDVEHSVFENRVYEVTTAGTTATKRLAYNTGLGVTTTDGTAVLTARDAFMRHAVVTSVTSRRVFSLSLDEPRAVDGWFKNGSMHIYDGSNAGSNVEIKEWTQLNNTIELYLPLPFAIDVGTRVRLYRGCQKRLDDDCVAVFANALNFRGEPFIPGSDAVLGYPDAR